MSVPVIIFQKDPGICRILAKILGREGLVQGKDFLIFENDLDLVAYSAIEPGEQQLLVTGCLTNAGVSETIEFLRGLKKKHPHLLLASFSFNGHLHDEVFDFHIRKGEGITIGYILVPAVKTFCRCRRQVG